MEKLRKGIVLASAAAGGIVGGGISLLGKLTRLPLVDELGESIVDSALYTGRVAGNIASGATDIVAGGLSGNTEKLRAGAEDIKTGGVQIASGLVDNVKTVAEHSGDILLGVRDGDGKRVARGAKTLLKVIAVSAVTVGIVRVREPKYEENR
jgi:hypothetical protein